MPAFGHVMARLGKALLPLFVLAVAVACGTVPPGAGQTVGRITYSVSGGIAGWQRTLVIQPDGTASIEVIHGPSPGTLRQQVDPAVLKRLHDLVRDPAFAALERQYLPSPEGADMQDYVVTAEVDGKSLQTMMRDGANPPQILRDVLGILNQILASAATH